MDTLDNCPEGSTCIVKKLIGHDRNRLAELGLSTGTEIKIINWDFCMTFLVQGCFANLIFKSEPILILKSVPCALLKGVIKN